MSAVRNLYEDMYTYRRYCEELDDSNRYEIIEGVPYLMAAPSDRHQAILGEIFARLHVFLRGKKCIVRISPYDVRLAIYGEFGDDVINVVQPDISVFCDKNKMDEKGGISAPDIAIEILSPSSAKNDRYRKLNLYEKAGVREYWIVDGANKTIEIFVLDNGKFVLKDFLLHEDTLTSSVLEGLEFKLSDIFLDTF